MALQGKWTRILDVSIKILKPGGLSPDKLIGEAKLLHRLRHKNILQLYAVVTDAEPCYIISEFMDNHYGFLLDYLRNDKERKVKLDDLVFMASQVPSLCFLHYRSF